MCEAHTLTQWGVAQRTPPDMMLMACPIWNARQPSGMRTCAQAPAPPASQGTQQHSFPLMYDSCFCELRGSKQAGTPRLVLWLQGSTGSTGMAEQGHASQEWPRTTIPVRNGQQAQHGLLTQHTWCSVPSCLRTKRPVVVSGAGTSAPSQRNCALVRPAAAKTGRAANSAPGGRPANKQSWSPCKQQRDQWLQTGDADGAKDHPTGLAVAGPSTFAPPPSTRACPCITWEGQSPPHL